MKYYEAKATILCGACANYNLDLGRGMIGHSRPAVYGPRVLKRPRAIRGLVWNGQSCPCPRSGLYVKTVQTSLRRNRELRPVKRLFSQHAFVWDTSFVQNQFYLLPCVAMFCDVITCKPYCKSS